MSKHNINVIGKRKKGKAENCLCVKKNSIHEYKKSAEKIGVVRRTLFEGTIFFCWNRGQINTFDVAKLKYDQKSSPFYSVEV